MADQMAAGLAADAPAPSSLLMLPTSVDILPDGHEAGEVFALEFGGSGTLRLLFARLSPTRRGETDTLDVEEVRLDPALKAVPAEALFDELASRLAVFVRRCGWDVAARGPPLLGFCFSFPLQQGADLASGTLVRWTKGFACPGAVGRDVSALLADACTRAGLPVSIGALVNDTVGALAAARYSDGDDAVVSLVLNAGTNAAYVELLSHVEKFYAAGGVGGGEGGRGGGGGERGDHPASPSFHGRAGGGLPRTSDLVINIEWRGFADALLPVLPDDVGGEGEGEGGEEGGEGEEPGAGAAAAFSSSSFERLTGPLYLGEAARRLLARLAAAGAWFVVPDASMGADRGAAARAAAALAVPGALDFTQVCRAAADCSADLHHVAEELGDALGVPPATIPPAARPEVRDACAALLRRSARLTAAGLAGCIAHLAAEAASRPDVSATLDLDASDVAAASAVFGGYGPGGGASFEQAAGPAAPPSPPGLALPPLSVPLPPAPPPPARRFVIAADGAMLRRGGRFIEELRSGLDDVLGAELASRVCVRVVEGGAGFGAAALAAAAHTQAVAMGAADLAGGPPRTYFTFPPRARASTPLAPPAAEGAEEGQPASKL